jgi:drug/metabolite transporter (DMT)-like permease
MGSEKKPGDAQPPYWFKAKRYGYGWGLPARREGWIAMGACVGGAIVFTGTAIALDAPVVVTVLVFFVPIVVLLVLCYWKGEEARWRWGEDDARSSAGNPRR